MTTNNEQNALSEVLNNTRVMTEDEQSALSSIESMRLSNIPGVENR